MTTKLFEYPKSAAFGRVLPKSKIYEHGSPGFELKQLFIRQVEQIIWQYKLARETVNLTGTQSVPEIQIFSIALKDGELKHEVLRCIDQAISFPIFFELRYEAKIKTIAAYKRPSEADGSNGCSATILKLAGCRMIRPVSLCRWFWTLKPCTSDCWHP